MMVVTDEVWVEGGESTSTRSSLSVIDTIKV